MSAFQCSTSSKLALSESSSRKSVQQYFLDMSRQACGIDAKTCQLNPTQERWKKHDEWNFSGLGFLSCLQVY